MSFVFNLQCEKSIPGNQNVDISILDLNAFDPKCDTEHFGLHHNSLPLYEQSIDFANLEPYGSDMPGLSRDAG
jgi:hypothetical protein